MELDIAIGKHLDSRSFKNTPVSWDWFAAKCSKPLKTAETAKEFAAMDKKQQGKIKSANGSFVAGYLKDGIRKKDSIISRSMLVLDADYASQGFWGNFELNFDCAALIYSTHKHTAEVPRYRLVIPLSREVVHDEYEAISRKVASMLDIELFDHTTHDINRYFFWPTASRDAKPVFKRQGGEFLDPDEILAMYRDWQDISSWPLSQKENKVIRALASKQGDPLEKEGLIGAFCRTFTIKEAIAEFLQGIYEETDNDENRYSYSEATTFGGVVVYDDKFSFSHHESDPATKKLCNAFDLIRLQKFWDLDDGKEGVPTNKLPSFIEMQKFIGDIPEVKRDVLARNFENARDEFDDDFSEFESDEEAEENSDEKGRPKWWGELEVSNKGILETSYKNIRLILENDKRLKGRFGQNTFSDRVEVLKRLPWDKDFTDVRVWSDDDQASLREYLGNAPYKIKRTPMMEDVLSGVKLRNGFNPVREYMEASDWDGENRIDTLLIDFLGAEDSEYNRAVTRATLIALVARVFEPGCKFDNILTLVGPQRKGKSTLIRKLAIKRKWFSDTFNFGMLQGGNGIRAIEQIQGILITEIAEVSGLRKAEAEAVKGFVSSDSDEYRPSHGKEKVFRPRKGIFIASSNDRNFLTASNGNGRWWPVDTHITKPVLSVWKDLDDDYLTQMWGEAYTAYKNGEQWHLTPEMEEEAEKHQAAHEQEDVWEGKIRYYLDGPEAKDFEAEDGERQEPLNRICVGQIYEECLGGDIRFLKNDDSRKIMAILRKFKDWRPLKSTGMFGKYGSQKGFIRIKTNERRISKQIDLYDKGPKKGQNIPKADKTYRKTN